MSTSRGITADRQIAALKPTASRYERAVAGARGLCLIVYPTGTKTFVLRYVAVGGERRRLPLGRTHLCRSLGTGRRSDAIRQARLVAADFERALRGDPRALLKRPQIACEAPNGDLTLNAAHAAPKPPEKTLRDLLTIFLDDPVKARGDKVRMIYNHTIPIVGEVLGMDTPLRSIDREACRRLMDMLRWLPTNSKKRFPKMTAVQASEMAKAKKLTSTLGYAAINSYLKCLSALMNFAVNEGYIDRNPAKGLRVVDPRHRRDRRLPFSNDQLRAIFNAPLYRGCVDDEYGYADVGSARPRRARFWVPLIALFSGMRMNEICQLDVADIRRLDGVDCFIVTGRSHGGTDDKKVKTSTSERFIPIHPRLTELGFLDFVGERRRSGSVKLFPELPLSTTGYYSDPFSKWLETSHTLQRIIEMPQSPYVEIALRLLSPTSLAWEQPTYCREVAARLRSDGEHDLAAQLDQAAHKPQPWLGGSAAV